MWSYIVLLQLKCEGCGELTEKEIGVRLSLGNGKGAPHLVRKVNPLSRSLASYNITIYNYCIVSVNGHRDLIGPCLNFPL